MIALITVLFWEIAQCTYSFIKYFLMESWQETGLAFGIDTVMSGVFIL